MCAAQTSGLLKQPDQVELSYCKCSPPGVSHFQGPHEHMRHSCETAEKERGWVYETASLYTLYILFRFGSRYFFKLSI